MGTNNVIFGRLREEAQMEGNDLLLALLDLYTDALPFVGRGHSGCTCKQCEATRKLTQTIFLTEEILNEADNEE